MKLLNIERNPSSEWSNAVRAVVTEFGVTLEVAEMGKVRLALAFKPDHARELAASLLKLADAAESPEGKAFFAKATS